MLRCSLTASASLAVWLMLFGGLAAQDDAASGRREHLQDASKLAATIEDDDLRSRVYYALTRAQANAGLTDDALLSAGEVTANGQLQIYSYLAVARQHLKSGDLLAARAAGEMARQTAILDRGGKGRIDTHMISWLAEQRLVEEAVDYVRKASPATSRSFGLQMFCAKIGETEGGDDLALEIMDKEIPQRFHDSTLLMMTRYCASAGPVDQALRYLERIRQPKYKDSALLELVTRQRRKGMDEETLRSWIDRISDAKVRAKAEAEAIGARKEAKAQDVAQLQSQIDKADNRDVKLALLQKLFASHIANQQPEKAEAAVDAMLKVVDQFPRPKEVTKFGSTDDTTVKKTLQAQKIKLLSLYLKQENKDAAARVQEEATTAAASIADGAGLSKFFTVQMVAGQLAGNKLSDAAREFMKKANAKGPFNAFALSGSASYFASQGKWDEARDAIKAHKEDKNGYWRSQAVGEVVKLLIAKKQFDRAPEFLNLLQKTDDDYQAYRVIAKAMLEAEERERLDAWLAGKPPAARAYAAMGLAD